MNIRYDSYQMHPKIKKKNSQVRQTKINKSLDKMYIKFFFIYDTMRSVSKIT